VTLALRLLRVRPRHRLLGLLHSRPVAALTAPAVVLLLHVGSLYAFYLPVLGGPLAAAHGHHVHVHALLHVHMVATGCLLSWYLVGLDPLRRSGGVGTRMVVLLAAAAAHDILAKLLYASPPAWAGPAEEVRRGAELMFYGGEAVEVLLAVVLLGDWYARRTRALARDRNRSAARPLPRAATTL
jgi:putative membrane protein